MEELAVWLRGAAHSLAQILDDRTAHSIAVGHREEIAHGLEPRFVRHVRRVSADDELDRPRPILVELGHEGADDLIELPDEHFLHLGMQVRFRFLDEDQMHARRCRRCLVLAEEPQQLEQHVNQITDAETVIGLRQGHAVDAYIADLGVVIQKLVDVKAGFSDEAGIGEAGIAEQVEGGQKRGQLRVEARVEVALDLLNGRLELLGGRPFLGIDGISESRLKEHLHDFA